MGPTAKIENSETLITPAEAARALGVSEREIRRRIKSGELPSAPGTSKGGRPGRLVKLSSLPESARSRWFRSKASQAQIQPALKCEIVAPLPAAPQADLFYTDALVALNVPNEKKDVINNRLDILRVAMNGDFRAAGYDRKEPFVNAVAKQHRVSGRSVFRWANKVKRQLGEEGAIDFNAAKNNRNALLALLDTPPGPPPSDPAILQDWQKVEILHCWTNLKLNIRQTYERLISLTREKANCEGWRNEDHYEFPNYYAVRKYISRLSPLSHAAREGDDELKQACGYIDRTYAGLKSLERVETDEWKCDVLAYRAERPKEVSRFYLLTFYDERSLYPLCWKLVEGERFDKRHGIKEEDEIDLLVCLLREYGVPGALVSDRGRFRGGAYGGAARDGQFTTANGILDRIGVKHEMPREKNPQGNRLERFHRFLADQSRLLPGWIGANEKEREMTPGDAQAEAHKRWCAGDEEVPMTPLLSTDQLRLVIDEWMEKWREHASEGTDMNGLSPRAVFLHNTPEGGFNKISDERLAWETAEQFNDVLIRAGGIVQLKDGARYSAPALLLIQGEKRTVRRVRWDHSQISVLPAAKGEEAIIAPRRARVGTRDPDNLARAMELKTRLRRLAGAIVETKELQLSAYEPGAAADRRDLSPAALSCDAAYPAPSDAPPIFDEKVPAALDFADLE